MFIVKTQMRLGCYSIDLQQRDVAEKANFQQGIIFPAVYYK